MAGRSLHRRLSIVAGLGALVVLVVAGWQLLPLLRHLWRLHQDPRHLVRIVHEPDGTVESRAVRLFVATRSGVRALLSAFLDAFGDAGSAGGDPTAKNELGPGLIGLAAAQDDPRPGPFWCDLGLPGWHERGFRFPASRLAHRLAALLPQASGVEVELEKYPGLLFVVLPSDQAREIYQQESTSRPCFWLKNPFGWTCVVRSAGAPANRPAATPGR